MSKSTKQFSKFQIRWNDKLGLEECPYLIRWVLNLKWFSIRVHHWIRSDDDRHFHDHAWNFWTLIVKGEYTDVSADGEELCQAPCLRYRKAEHAHTVKVGENGAWTIMLTGPMIRKWGFWVDGKLKRPLKYFHKFGHHPCED